jgi:hypothetical protein
MDTEGQGVKGIPLVYRDSALPKRRDASSRAAREIGRFRASESRI